MNKLKTAFQSGLNYFLPSSGAIWRKYLAISLGWILLIGGSLAWNLHQLELATLNSVISAARSSLNKDINIRNWAEAHGGVYVQPTRRTPPNPYLNMPERDVITTKGMALTLLNSAYIIREIQRDYSGNLGIRSHLTSLKLLNPDNAPDEWETRALKGFDRGSKEALNVSQIEGKSYLRLMLPLPMTDNCFKCHNHQDYKTGDNRGGISASVLLQPYTDAQLTHGNQLKITHGIILLIGLLGLLLTYRRTKLTTEEREVAQEKIRVLAYYDDLTHLPNRHLLLERIRMANDVSARSGKSAAVLFVDLDDFKIINETKGYAAGDALLRMVAQRLSDSASEGDTVARLGSDEFAIVLTTLETGLQEVQAGLVAEKLQVILSRPYQLESFIYNITASIGIKIFNGMQHDLDDLLKHAEVAMHQAKTAGRNTICFHDNDMQFQLEARAEMERELRIALDQQQFQLYYQMQVNNQNRILGAEALIRWIHPERGIISPAQFIPLAEDSKLIVPIGYWVLDNACAQIKIWEQDVLTRDLVLAVNVSAQQFHFSDFADQVQAVVEHYAIRPGLLKLELTESMLVEDVERIIATMNRLKKIGIKFSLDDFGTGYSSLQYLKRLPLDQLKIDQSFVRNLATDDSDKAIVSTIIAMAQSLNFDVIAEGVETEEQRQLLMGRGNHHFQGYLFGKPVPIAQFEALLKLANS